MFRGIVLSLLLATPAAAEAVPSKPGKVTPAELTEHQRIMPVKCYKYEDLASQLAGQYQEQMKEGGDSGPNRGEFWKSRGGATWTWIIRLTDGLACIVGAGTNWRK